MRNNQVPPSIRFNEEPLHTAAANRHSLVNIVKTASFGLIKTDAQATFVVIILVIAVMVFSVMFVRDQQTVVPTTYYEISPQESIGSPQGLPSVQQFKQYE